MRQISRFASRAATCAALATCVVCPGAAFAVENYYVAADGGGAPFETASGPSPVAISSLNTISGVTRTWDASADPGWVSAYALIDGAGGQTITGMRTYADMEFDDFLAETDDLIFGAAFVITIYLEVHGELGEGSVGQILQDPGFAVTAPSYFGSYAKGSGGTHALAFLAAGLSTIDLAGPNKIGISVTVFNGLPFSFWTYFHAASSVNNNGSTYADLDLHFPVGVMAVANDTQLDWTLNSPQALIVDTVYMPEPSGLLLLAFGVPALAWMARRRA